eukprot:19544-Chlamydomonas_euryale.AAC.1
MPIPSDVVMPIPSDVVMPISTSTGVVPALYRSCTHTAFTPPPIHPFLHRLLIDLHMRRDGLDGLDMYRLNRRRSKDRSTKGLPKSQKHRCDAWIARPWPPWRAWRRLDDLAALAAGIACGCSSTRWWLNEMCRRPHGTTAAAAVVGTRPVVRPPPPASSSRLPRAVRL